MDSILYKAFFFICFLFSIFLSCKQEIGNQNYFNEKIQDIQEKVSYYFEHKNNYKIIIGSFLGDNKRCYYGKNPPSKLKLIWKCWLGGKKVYMPYNNTGTNIRYGGGWTGQPLLFEENNKLFLIQGSYDGNLRKIDAENGKIIWEYTFDNSIKGTGTLYINKTAKNDDDELIILQGSKATANSLYNFRGISALNGKELFRMKVTKTNSYSRDVDGSALIIENVAYIGLENGLFKIFSPNPDSTIKSGRYFEPLEYKELNLFNKSGRTFGNIITESSPSFLNGKVYITAGSGIVFGYDISKKEIDWEFIIGADLNGSPVITEDNCLLVSVEKQFIKGYGGMLKLNPSKPTDNNAIEWYFPTGNINFLSWNGGIIGSASINDKYKSEDLKSLAAFSGIDGYLYVVDYKKIDGTTVSFDGKSIVKKPELIFKYKIGSSISTPLIFKDKIIACSYSGIYLFEFDNEYNFNLIDKIRYTFEATPIVYEKRIYIASKDGWLYCFGDK